MAGSFHVKIQEHIILLHMDRNGSCNDRFLAVVTDSRFIFFYQKDFPASRGLSRQGKNERKERDLSRLPLTFALPLDLLTSRAQRAQREASERL